MSFLSRMYTKWSITFSKSEVRGNRAFLTIWSNMPVVGPSPHSSPHLPPQASLLMKVPTLSTLLPDAGVSLLRLLVLIVDGVMSTAGRGRLFSVLCCCCGLVSFWRISCSFPLEDDSFSVAGSNALLAPCSWKQCKWVWERTWDDCSLLFYSCKFFESSFCPLCLTKF